MLQILFTWSHSKKAQVTSLIVNIITKNDLISGKYIQTYGHLAYSFFFKSDPDDDITLESYLNGDGKYNVERVKEIAKQLNVDHLLPLSFLKLSNGQTRRARIAKALLKNPSMLVLDEPLSNILYLFFLH